MIGWFKNLVNDSLVYGIGFGVSRFLQIIVLPIIAHSLSLSEYGYYSNYVIFYSIAGGVFVLGMDNSVARFYYDSEDKQYHRKLFSIGFFSVLLTSFACVTLASFFPAGLLKTINVPANYKSPLPFVLYTIPFLALNYFFLSWFKWRRKKKFFLINSIGSVLSLLLPLLLIKPVTFTFVLKTIFFSQLIVAVTSMILASGYIQLIFDKKLFISMLKYGFPWMLVFFLGLSRSYIDRFFLTHYLNDDNYGIYNFSARLSTLLSLFLTAFDMSFGPLALSIWNKNEAPKFFARLQSIYILFIGIAACVISIVSPFLVSVLGGSKYNGAEKVLPFLLFSAIPLSLINFSSLGMIYAKKSFLNTITLTIGFTVVLALNFLLTPVYLQYGAVNASIIGHCCIAAAGYYFSRRYYKIPFRFGKDILIFIFLLIFAIVSVNFYFSGNTYLDIGFKIAILTVLSLLLFVFVFKEEYRKMQDIIKNIRIKAPA